MMKNNCPVCGYTLSFMAYYDDGSASFEICSCCGFQFGFDDSSEGLSFKEYRTNWLKEGACFFSQERMPNNWSIKSALLQIENTTDTPYKENM